MIQTHGYADDRDDLPVFIHSELDDYGLDPYQFRVYARIARRAGRQGAYESIKKMAEGCCMSEGKAKSSLRFLIEQGLVTRESREGYTSIYRLNPKSKWLAKKQLTEVGTEQPGSPSVHPPGSPSVHPPGSPSVHPPGSPGVHKGNSIKGSPLQINPDEVSPKIPPITPRVEAIAPQKKEGDETHAVVVEVATQDEEVTVRQPLVAQSSILAYQEQSVPPSENQNHFQALMVKNPKTGENYLPWQGMIYEHGRPRTGNDPAFVNYVAGRISKYSLYKNLPLTELLMEADKYLNDYNRKPGRKEEIDNYWREYCNPSPLSNVTVKDIKQQATENNLMSMLSDRLSQRSQP